MDLKLRMASDFAHCYGHMCATLGLSPLSCVTVKNRELIVNADKVGASDWIPLLNALKINEALEAVVIHCRTNAQDTIKNGRKIITAIKSEDIIFRLCTSIRECLIVNGKIKTLSLIGLNLKDMDIKTLSKGIQRNKSLTQLSLEKSLNGAKHFKEILEALKSNMRISCVNFSGCSIDAAFTHLLADYIRMSIRHDQVWQDGLRYRRPALDSMGGLRRITINDNSQLGDEGVEILCSVMKEDIWIKALDVQNCNITNEGGKNLLRMLELNAALVVVDARRNLDLDSELLQKMRHQCRINWGSQESEFKWLNINGNVKKNTLSSQHHTKSLSTISTITVSPKGTVLSKMDGNHSGIPWRAARRANRARNISPERKDVSTPNSINKSSLKINHCQEYNIEPMEMDCEVQSLKDKVKTLTEENDYLRNKCQELEKKQIETEETLDVIENSFTNFHKFLDMLRHVGLGHLITMAKLNDTTEIPHEDGESLLNQPELKPLETATDHFSRNGQASSHSKGRNGPSNKEEGGGETVGLNKKKANFQELINSIKIGENLMRASPSTNVTTIEGDSTREKDKDTVHWDSQGIPQKYEKHLSDFEPEVLRLKEGQTSWFQAVENSDYSLNFDSTSPTNEDASSTDQSSASHDNGAPEIQDLWSYLPSLHLKDEEIFSATKNRYLSLVSND